MLDFIELSPDHSIVEFEAPANFAGKTLKELALRTKKGINVVAIKRGDDVEILPGGDTEVEDGDILVAVGHQDCVREITDSLEKRR